MKNNQEQKSGDNSEQIQAGMIVINQGIEEKRAREIFMEMFENSRKSFSLDAIEKAEERVRKFEDDLIPKMQKIEGALESFADPLFQVMLTSAHKTAAVTTNEDDYSILSELLIHKIKKGNDRKAIAAISRAIEIVNEIPEESLLGLTVEYAWDIITPNSGIISEGLNILDELFSKLIYDKLPEGENWIEQLDVLNAIRIRDFSNFKKFEEYYSEKMNGYCCAGIKKDTEDYFKACELLNSINISNLLIENELDKEYVRLAIVNKDQIDTMERIILDIRTGEKIIKALLDNEKEILNNIFDMYEKTINQEIKEKFVREIENRPNLKKLREWINNIKMSYNVTPIGKILAHANAQRCYKDFPPLN